MPSQQYLIPDWPVSNVVNALFSLRVGGVSQAPYASLNLGLHVGDAPEDVAENRERLSKYLATANTGAKSLQDSTPINPVWLWQKHTTRAVILDEQSLHRAPDVIEADACISNTVGLACAVQVADCLPVLFANADGSWVAAAHAGWRGLQAGVLESTVATMREQIRMQTKTKQASSELYAWLGPCIGPTRFEVGEEVLRAFLQNSVDTSSSFNKDSCAANRLGDYTQEAIRACFVPCNRTDKYLCNLAGLARMRLQALGVRHIYGNNGRQLWCTYVNQASFFSHRRDNARWGASGRMAACVWRKTTAT